MYCLRLCPAAGLIVARNSRIHHGTNLTMSSACVFIAGLLRECMIVNASGRNVMPNVTPGCRKMQLKSISSIFCFQDADNSRINDLLLRLIKSPVVF